MYPSPCLSPPGAPRGWVVRRGYVGSCLPATVLSVNVLVVDLAVVDCRLSGADVEVHVPGLGVVSRVPLLGPPDAGVSAAPAAAGGLSRREAVFRALDAALDSARVPVGRSWARLAFYNPLSAEVAVDAVPRTVAFCCSAPLELPLEGALGVVADGTLRVAGLELYPRSDEFAHVHQAISAHFG